MYDLEGKLKLLLLFIVCGGIVYSFWQTLEKGGKIIALGKEKPSHLQETLPRPLSRAAFPAGRDSGRFQEKSLRSEKKIFRRRAAPGRAVGRHLQTRE